MSEIEAEPGLRKLRKYIAKLGCSSSDRFALVHVLNEQHCTQNRPMLRLINRIGMDHYGPSARCEFLKNMNNCFLLEGRERARRVNGDEGEKVERLRLGIPEKRLQFGNS